MNVTSMKTGKVLMAAPPAHVCFTSRLGRCPQRQLLVRLGPFRPSHGHVQLDGSSYDLVVSSLAVSQDSSEHVSFPPAAPEDQTVDVGTHDLSWFDLIPVWTSHQLSPLQERKLGKTLSCTTDILLPLVPLTEKSWWSAPPLTPWRFSWTPSGLSETAQKTTEAAAATSAAYLTGSWTPAAVWWVVRPWVVPSVRRQKYSEQNREPPSERPRLKVAWIPSPSALKSTHLHEYSDVTVAVRGVLRQGWARQRRALSNQQMYQACSFASPSADSNAILDIWRLLECLPHPPAQCPLPSFPPTL